MDIYPALGDSFLKRESILGVFKKRLQAFAQGYRQNIGLIGIPLTGKSSLMYLMCDAIREMEMIPVLFRCRESESFERFSDRWMAEILLSCYRISFGNAPSQFHDILRSLRSLIPRTLKQMKKVKKSVFAYRFDQAYRELLSLNGILSEEYKKKVVLMIDDFDRLAELKLTDPFSAFGEEIMIQKETMYIVSSSKPKQGRAILQEKLSLLFGNFEVVENHPFDFEEAKEFIKTRLAGRELDERYVCFLIRMTDGHPYYLDILTSRLKSYLSVPDLSDEQLIVRTFARELDDKSGMLHHYFQMQLHSLQAGRSWLLAADTLAAISAGHKKFIPITRFLHQAKNDMKKVLQRLVNGEMIQKHGSIFIIPDPLFRFWLASVYHRDRFLFHSDRIQARQAFVREVEQAIQKSIHADASELPKRIEELFRQFKNDVVEMQERKLMCPQFSEVISKPNNGRVFPVVAKSAKTRWMCQVLSQRVTEEDIHVFVQDLERLRSPVQKRMIVGLRGIDLNAKLLAQEAKIHYLDLRKFNFLLDLYDRPKLVI
ncbi:MAG: hypothetical protein A3G33_05420 [Omnitrophica bacterium RIFCSPLOWO2_12_FULL_44_17]|uniref:Orc1-like AAA ATPase domain-containing protein n=1 Tax=Candidatus Danuiimicrobium aquiferis TaxID=1801832 RepID=A0A1G1L0P0_9BACT|nr:MAG: hypothetical protein A3B72_04690 [Omnitrophica bacterium RIFCSPHIGHO2_02_FULL_45_28]OGW89862.1 MAG: hypothetical protein A3E74_07310 [Omnitrophica bacterium RIFCSPHIGHO2_12_FULL_44_12]OGW98713.1 MAG: hypothetical protein A3G33_05420 [Omnitrophica bacterium RIFCSPLOWO2_12_FULL_44_17]OGX03104.1 MAG: hypothetical protein A3J12_05825 [Omnitrophica bacterium RIFCSPLOWO2_02_FULL_44_11]